MVKIFLRASALIMVDIEYGRKLKGLNHSRNFWVTRKLWSNNDSKNIYVFQGAKHPTEEIIDMYVFESRKKRF